MSKYRPIDVRLWNDRKFLSLSDDARVLWIFLLTTPSTLPIPGVVVGGDAALAEQLGWLPERFAKRFQELARKGLAVRKEGRLIWLSNALKYQPPPNPNVVIGWSKSWDDVPESNLKHEIWQALEIACKSWSRLFAKLFTEPFRDGSSNGSANGSGNDYTQDQDQDQDQKQDQDQDQVTVSPPARRRARGTEPMAAVNPPRKQAIATYFRFFEDAYGHQPTFGPRQGKQVDRLLKAHGLAEFERRLAILFTSPPSWLKPPYDLGTLESQFDKLVQPSLSNGSNGVKHGRIEPHTADAYADGEVPL